MRACLLSLIVLAGFQASAGTKVLDCVPEFGPDKSIVVEQQGSKLILKEVEMSARGEETSREVTMQEWKSGRLILRSEGPSEQNILEKDEGGWFLLSRSPGFNQSGYIDCK